MIVQPKYVKLNTALLSFYGVPTNIANCYYYYLFDLLISTKHYNHCKKTRWITKPSSYKTSLKFSDQTDVGIKLFFSLPAVMLITLGVEQ